MNGSCDAQGGNVVPMIQRWRPVELSLYRLCRRAKTRPEHGTGGQSISAAPKQTARAILSAQAAVRFGPPQSKTPELFLARAVYLILA